MSPMDDAEPIDSKSPPLPQAELDILTDKLIRPGDPGRHL